MVQHEPDARSILSLVAGGTDYCQALTIIVDDIEGYLPLDPTKQVGVLCLHCFPTQ